MDRADMPAATGVPSNNYHNMEKFKGGENMSPGSHFPIKTTSDRGEMHLRAMVWGLVPGFTPPGASPDHFKMFNARSETVTEKVSFAKLMRSQRGVVFMNGYYEWKKEAGVKQPYYVYRKNGELLKMACVFDTWKQHNEEPLYSFSILTAEAHKSIAWLHNRQPLFLIHDEDEAAWIDPATPRDTINNILTSTAIPPDLSIHQVTRKMSNMSYQEADCCVAIPQERKASSFFCKAEDPVASSRIKAEADQTPSASAGEGSTRPTPSPARVKKREAEKLPVFNNKGICSYFGPSSDNKRLELCTSGVTDFLFSVINSFHCLFYQVENVFFACQHTTSYGGR